MCRDERIYPNPEEFKPERFISADGTLITENFPPTYGFGRRSVIQLSFVTPTYMLTNATSISACAGKSMADNSVWIAMASILAAFQISKAKDASGNIIEVPDEYIDGLVTSVFSSSFLTPRSDAPFLSFCDSAPVPFDCAMVPRSEAARKLITETPPLKLHSNPMYYDEKLHGAINS